MSNFLHALGEIVTNESAYRNAAIAAVVLLFASSGELVAEKAGTINISLEGMMLAGAFAAAVGQDLTGSVWLALLFGMVAGVLVALVQANMSHRLPADQFVVGLVLNVLVLGLVGFLASEIDPKTNVVGRVEVPLLSHIPLVGPGAVRRALGAVPRVRHHPDHLVADLPHALGTRGARRRRRPERLRRLGSARQQACAARRSTSPG